MMIKTAPPFSPAIQTASLPPEVLNHCLAFASGFCTRINPLRPLDWRWRAGLGLVAAARVSSKLYDDPVRQLRKLLKQHFACSEPDKNARFWRRHVDLGCAIAIAQSDSPQRPLLEAWILSTTPVGQIAEVTGIPEKMIEFYECYFYDIARRDHDFMFDVAVRRPRHPGPVESLATQVLKLGAWKGGRPMLERLLELDDDTLAGMHPQIMRPDQRYANPQEPAPEPVKRDPFLRRGVMQELR